MSLQRAIPILIAKAREVNGTRNQDQEVEAQNDRNGLPIPTARELEKSTTVLLKMIQGEAFAEDIKLLNTTAEQGDANRQDTRNKTTLKKSCLYGLDLIEFRLVSRMLVHGCLLTT